MEMEIINAGDPLVILASIPASCQSREMREHEAGLRLLSMGMEYLGLEMDEIIHNKYGKPYFQGKHLPYFSISHSSSYVACTIAQHEIGCDLENNKKVPKILSRELGKVKCFIKDEINRTSKRTVLWTVYEAVAKCIGKGIPLEENIDSAEWIVKTWLPKDDYALTVAYKKTGV